MNKEMNVNFLLEFTEELVKCSAPEIFLKQEIAVRELMEKRRREADLIRTVRIVAGKLRMKSPPPKINPPIKTKQYITEASKPSLSLFYQPQTQELKNLGEQNFGEKMTKESEDMTGFQESILSQNPQPQEQEQIVYPIENLQPEQSYGEYQGQEFDLGKLSYLLNDDRIESIECSGAGQFILVKINGVMNITQTTLEEKEINEIIEIFSRNTNTPVTPGIFKTTFGNLMLTAIPSDLVGSRFIIQRVSGY